MIKLPALLEINNHYTKICIRRGEEEETPNNRRSSEHSPLHLCSDFINIKMSIYCTSKSPNYLYRYTSAFIQIPAIPDIIRTKECRFLDTSPWIHVRATSEPVYKLEFAVTELRHSITQVIPSVLFYERIDARLSGGNREKESARLHFTANVDNRRIYRKLSASGVKNTPRYPMTVYMRLVTTPPPLSVCVCVSRVHYRFTSRPCA